MELGRIVPKKLESAHGGGGSGTPSDPTQAPQELSAHQVEIIVQTPQGPVHVRSDNIAAAAKAATELQAAQPPFVTTQRQSKRTPRPRPGLSPLPPAGVTAPEPPILPTTTPNAPAQPAAPVTVWVDSLNQPPDVVVEPPEAPVGARPGSGGFRGWMGQRAQNYIHRQEQREREAGRAQGRAEQAAVDTAEISRTRRNSLGRGVVIGGILGGILTAGVIAAYNNARNADLPHTILAGTCITDVKPGSIVVANDYSLDGTRVTEPSGQADIIEVTTDTKVCVFSKNGMFQTIGDTGSERLDALTHNYMEKLRRGGFSSFKIIDH